MYRIDSIKTKTFRDLVENARTVATVSHTHPDGDAVGSSLGMAEWLRSLGKDVTTVFPDPIPATLQFMLSDEAKGKCLIYTEDPDEVRQLLDRCDLIICLDFPAAHRTEAMAEVLCAASAPKVQVDHHMDPQADLFALSFSEEEISSASELAFWVMDAAGAELPLSAATALMTGMTTDTNNFANSTYPSTFEMASRLLELGVDRDAILERLNWSYEERRLRAMGRLLTQMKVTDKGAAYMILYAADSADFGLKEGETEGFVNLPLGIRKVRMSLFLKETDEGHFRVSVRSKQGTSAAETARKHFHGGGHERAAGGKLYFPQDIPSPADAAAYIEKVTDEDLD